MRLAVITNLRDKKGLWRDARILEALFRDWGHDCRSYDFRDIPGLPRDHAWYTVVVHLETVAPRALSWSDKHLWFINPDWSSYERLSWADAFRLVLAKSREGERQLRVAGLPRVHYVGFESEDCLQPGVGRERAFFHSWCGNINKGTRTVLRAFEYDGTRELPTRFYYGSPIPERELRRQQNACLFHVLPSAVEGYGHSIHEALSCGAIVATVDGPPMNESLGIASKVKARRVSRQNLADLYECRPEDLAKAAEWMWSLDDEQIKALRDRARQAYLSERAAFRERFREALEGL